MGHESHIEPWSPFDCRSALLVSADPSEDSTPTPISKARLEGSALHITVENGFEFTVNLKDDTHADIKPQLAPANLKPIPAEKVH